MTPRESLSAERGSGTVLALGLIMVLLILLAAVQIVSLAAASAAQAARGADLAALAAADAARGLSLGSPCTVAQEVAARNAVELTSCTSTSVTTAPRCWCAPRCRCCPSACSMPAVWRHPGCSPTARREPDLHRDAQPGCPSRRGAATRGAALVTRSGSEPGEQRRKQRDPLGDRFQTDLFMIGVGSLAVGPQAVEGRQG